MTAPASPPTLAELSRRAIAFSRRRFLAIVALLAPGALAAGAWWPRDLDVPRPGGGPVEPGGSPAPGEPGAGQPAWAFGVDTTTCIGCGRCVEACKLENGVPLNPECNRTWVERHAVAADGTVYVDSPHAGIDGFPTLSTAPGAATADIRHSFFMPRLCMQCENPPCVGVCPVGATYRTAEGVVLVDQNRCVGCGYCVVACPYGARYLIPAGETSPMGSAGVADKCTWCYHRITTGRQPACVEVCPVGARIFGDLDDPESPIQAVVRQPGVSLLRPDLGTEPRVFYVGLEGEVA
jgi:Fe-S-cluster-containing dehydrogenase component